VAVFFYAGQSVENDVFDVIIRLAAIGGFGIKNQFNGINISLIFDIKRIRHISIL
jgi:hypothetical protein